MSSSNARFRYRTPSGEEVEIASVDQLSRRIASGEIRADTPLFDAGTGAWTKAGDAPVFRFIVEELEGDGDGPGGERAPDPDPHGTEADPESEDADEELPLMPDPFGPDAERAQVVTGPPPPPSPPERTAEPLGEEEDDDEFGPIVFGDPPPSREEPGGPSRRSPDAPAPPSPAPARAPREAERVEGLESELAGPSTPASGPSRAETEPIRSRPPPGSEGRSRGRVRRRQGVEVPIPLLVAAAVALVALGAGGWWWLSGGTATTELPDAPRTSPTAESEEAPARPFPSDVNGLLAGLMANELDRLTDSVRVDAGVPSAPPGEWLSGQYLSGASDHDAVVDFWEAYAGFMDELLGADSTLYVAAARRILEADPEDPSADEIAQRTAQLPGDLDIPAVLGQVEARWGEVAVERVERIEQLRETAVAAVRLHEFLVVNEDRIEHSPVLGQGVSRDPILEAVPDAPELRRELERHLDDVFRSLDRSRQGGPPSPAGLRVELFERFSRPL